MDPDTWLTHLTATLTDGGADAAADHAVPALADGERDALLDLARIAAHTSERWTAPVSTFLVGLSYASLPAGERAARLRSLVDRLDDPDRA